MSRFQVLEMLAAARFPRTIPALQLEKGIWRHADVESLRTQLNRLSRWGLARRSRSIYYSRYRYEVTMRGRERLAWARKQNLI